MNKLKQIITKERLPFTLLILFAVIFLSAGLANHFCFRSFTFDYGNYNFAFWDYSHFRISSIPTYPGNFLQDHFSFTLFYFTPVYWLLNWLTGTYTLIIIQHVLMAVAAWYSYKLVRLKTGNLWIGIALIAYYYLLLGRFTMLSCDVNLAVMSSAFIPIFLYYFQIRKYLIAFIVFILALLSRENIPIWFIFIFVVLMLEHKKEKKVALLCIGGILISLLYFILLFKVIIPSIENEEKQFTLFNYSALGENPGTALLFVFKHPIETLKLFFINHTENPANNGIKVEFYLVYLISGGILLLWRPKYFIWLIPIVAQKVLNDAPLRWGIATYYSTEIITLLPLSVMLTISDIRNKKVQNYLTLITCIAALSMTIHKMDRSNVKVPDAFIPAKEKFYGKSFYHSPYQLLTTHKLINEIPLEAKVSASDHLLAHLAQRQYIYLFPEVNDAEYIVFSVFDNYFLMSHMENETRRNKYFNSPEWKVINEAFPVFLLKRTTNLDSSDNHSVFDNYQTKTLFCDFENVDTTTNLILFNNTDLTVDLKNNQSTNVFKSKQNSLVLSRQNPFGKAISFNAEAGQKYIKVNVWVKGNEEKAFIVAKYNHIFNYHSNTVTEQDDTGWKQLELTCWLPRKKDNNEFFIYLWNANEDPIYFDDLSITIWHEN
ncbi:DUF2079 domain-containing protein [Maribellus sp. CM-23]|uniref:DUF2079 domain-containing protein n=1 Tax=Maribellus sp. CM-23 TaxID=2781026 RepID=UPI001F27C9F7|nr:DUF2079 domain-containing protein [Maribellus sp. CM-23]MCE4563600.1 DUF2079 domain-containing protein [Maribellus sp. CM-23]